MTEEKKKDTKSHLPDVAFQSFANVCNGIHIYSNPEKWGNWTTRALNNVSEEELLKIMVQHSTKAVMIVQHCQDKLRAMLKEFSERPEVPKDKEEWAKLSAKSIEVMKVLYGEDKDNLGELLRMEERLPGYCGRYIRAHRLYRWSDSADLWMLRLHNSKEEMP